MVGEKPEKTKKMGNVIFQAEDRALCEALLAAAARADERLNPLPDIAVALGRHFIGTPYRPQPLGSGVVESLVVNLRAFDCVTFVESVAALALAIRSGETDCTRFLTLLEKIRYRDGRMDGYPSRLHYFTDWIRDNERKFILTDVTSALGGIPVVKNLSFLTSNPDGNPPLRDSTVLQKMRQIEQLCSRQGFHYIPKLRWQKAEEGVADGDIIAVTSSRDDLDVLHTGLAIRVNRKIRLLHASSRAGSVVLSESTLNSYLREKRSRTGVIVARLTDRDVRQSSEKSSPIMTSSKATSR